MRRTLLLLLSGLSFASVAPGLSFAESPAVARPSPRDAYGDYITEAAQRFGLPAAWIRAILPAESNGDPRAVSSKGAMGLMQVMPETWADLRVRHRLGSDPYDPHDNIIAGAAYIRLLYDRYGSPGWIAAYNAGPGRYEASLKGRPLPSETAPMSLPSRRISTAAAIPAPPSSRRSILCPGPARRCLSRSRQANPPPIPCQPNIRRTMLRGR